MKLKGKKRMKNNKFNMGTMTFSFYKYVIEIKVETEEKLHIQQGHSTV